MNLSVVDFFFFIFTYVRHIHDIDAFPWYATGSLTILLHTRVYLTLFQLKKDLLISWNRFTLSMYRKVVKNVRQTFLTQKWKRSPPQDRVKRLICIPCLSVSHQICCPFLYGQKVCIFRTMNCEKWRMFLWPAFILIYFLCVYVFFMNESITWNLDDNDLAHWIWWRVQQKRVDFSVRKPLKLKIVCTSQRTNFHNIPYSSAFKLQIAALKGILPSFAWKKKVFHVDVKLNLNGFNQLSWYSSHPLRSSSRTSRFWWYCLL